MFNGRTCPHTRQIIFPHDAGRPQIGQGGAMVVGRIAARQRHIFQMIGALKTVIIGNQHFPAPNLKYVPLPGGDTAVKRPYRTALAYLWSAGIMWEDDLACVRACTAVEQNIILRQLETGLNAVPTSSMGRLFDAVAALANVRQTVTYEAQAAIEMETLARPLAGQIQEGYTFAITANIFDAAPLIQAVVADLRTGVSSAAIAAKFHDALARLILQISQKIRIETGLNLVGLSGGVFQNAALLEQAVALLQAAGFSVLTHALVPPNDGGLALGQAIIGSNSTQT